MKIWIVYASCGTGHKKAALALYDEFCKKQRDVVAFDLLDYAVWPFKKIYSKGYRFLVIRLPLIWKLFYHFTNFKILKNVNNFFISQLNRPIFRKLYVNFKKEKPDIVISTHFFVNNLIYDFKKIKDIHFVSVITDFSAHFLWVNKLVDNYVVASEFTKNELISMGIDKNKILPLGIPVNEGFIKNYATEELCKKYDLPIETPRILIVTGTFGLGPIEKIINLLGDKYQILAVCGNNKALYNRLNKLKCGYLKVFGCVDFMQELTALSNAVITKPGGISIAECLASATPMALISPIPGQEKRNLDILIKHKTAVFLKDINKAKEVMESLLNVVNRDKIKINMRHLAKPFAAKEITYAVCEGSLKYSSSRPV